jgi:predicted phage terminase large subunit-like protein
MQISRDEFDAVMRRDFSAFVQRCFHELRGLEDYKHNWHIDEMAARMEALRRGELKRLIVNMPPRSLKSIMVSVAYSAWVLGHEPSTDIICVSYGQDLAEKLSRDTLKIMRSSWYQRLFPKTRLSPNRQSVAEFETTKGGSRKATSVGGTITGFGGDLIIMDDPQKPDEANSDALRANTNDWYQNTLVSRLNNKVDGRMIICMQRVHEYDLVGHVLSLSPWNVLSYPAIAEQREEHVIEMPFGGRQTVIREIGEALHPEREPLAALERLRKELSAYNFAAQYQQNPAPAGGGLVKERWFPRYGPEDLPTLFDVIIQSWDTANTKSTWSDFSVCSTWGIRGEDIYLLHVYREKVEFPELKTAVRRLAKEHRASVILIEEKGSGVQLLQELRRERLRGLQGVIPKIHKIDRMNAQTPTIEAGHVYIPAESSWLDAYLNELMRFPSSQHADQVDSTSQALEWCSARRDVDPAVLWMDRESAKALGLGQYQAVIGGRPGSVNVAGGPSGRSYVRQDDGYFYIPASDLKHFLERGYDLIRDVQWAWLADEETIIRMGYWR